MLLFIEINRKIHALLEEHGPETLLRIPQGESRKDGKEDIAFNKSLNKLIDQRKLSEAQEEPQSFLCYSSSYPPEEILELFHNCSVKIKSIKVESGPEVQEAKGRFGRWTHEDTIFYKGQDSQDFVIILAIVLLFILSLIGVTILSIRLHS